MNPENYKPNPKPRKRKTQEERLAEIQEKKKRLLALENKLKKSNSNELRKKRSHTFYTFGGEMFSDNWEELRKILIDEKSWHTIEVIIDDKLFVNKTKLTD